MLTLTMPSKKAQDEPQKVTVAGRVPAVIQKKLEAIAEAMRPKPTISQLVALAIEEFVERRENSKQQR